MGEIQNLIRRVGSLNLNQWLHSEAKECGKYLIYQVDEDLSIVPTKTSNHPNLMVVREDIHDQGDAFVCDDRTADQTFPRRDTAHEKLVGPLMHDPS